MHIESYNEAILNCRFCFMCRHLSAIGNVRFTEVDTPRVRAAMLYGLRTGTNSFDDEDFVDALYRQDLSACCVPHCRRAQGPCLQPTLSTSFPAAGMQAALVTSLPRSELGQRLLSEPCTWDSSPAARLSTPDKPALHCL